MSHYTELSPLEKGKILAYMENFNPAQIARKMGRDPTTIRWPPALNNNEKNALINEVKKNRREPLHEIINTLGLSCSLTTARQTLYDAGIHSHVAAKKPFVSKKHALARVSWCEKYKEKTIQDWNQVIFSDESSVEIGNGQKSVMVWGFCELTGRAAIFQQDNAPIHTAKITKNWLKKNKIAIIDWPANSPDLNPIENIWKQLKDNIQARKTFPRTVSKLKVALSEEWENLDCSIFEEVVASMPQIINAVLEAREGPTHY
ncbi:IS630 family transposase [Rhizophagus irregularis DAOM 181602=DAOM 197198]|nr:IS630 family transposase [Rhizophagus irregularis DAOM 181602=DAOM 197198]